MHCSGLKKPKQFLTLKDKLEILKVYDTIGGNVNLNELSRTLHVSRSLLISTINNRQSIEEAPEKDQHRFRVRNKRGNPQAGKTKYKELEEKLVKWVEECQNKDLVVNGVILRKQAKRLAYQLGFDTFTASNGWSDRFKKKYGIEYKKKKCSCSDKDSMPYKLSRNRLQGSFDESNLIQENANSNSRNNLIEEKLMLWVDKTKNDHMKMNKTMLKEMALSIAGIYGVTEFSPTNNWLNQFQKNYRLKRNKNCLKCNKLMQDSVKDQQDVEVFKDDELDTESFILESDCTKHQTLDSISDDGYELDVLESSPSLKRKKRRCVDNEKNKRGSCISKEDSGSDKMKQFYKCKVKIEQIEDRRQLLLKRDKLKYELDVLQIKRRVIESRKQNLFLQLELLKLDDDNIC